MLQSSELIRIGDDLFRIIRSIDPEWLQKAKTEDIAKYFGGNKVVRKNDEYFVCEEVLEAIFTDINTEDIEEKISKIKEL